MFCDLAFFSLWATLSIIFLHCSATITSSSENEERSTSSEVPTKEEGPGGSAGVTGPANDGHHPRTAGDNLTAQQDEALPRTEIMEPRTPPAPKRPLPQHHIHSTSSLVMTRPNSVAGTFTNFLFTYDYVMKGRVWLLESSWVLLLFAFLLRVWWKDCYSFS